MECLCIVINAWDREHGDNVISVVGSTDGMEEHDDNEDSMKVMGWDVRMKRKTKAL